MKIEIRTYTVISLVVILIGVSIYALSQHRALQEHQVYCNKHHADVERLYQTYSDYDSLRAVCDSLQSVINGQKWDINN